MTPNVSPKALGRALLEAATRGRRSGLACSRRRETKKRYDYASRIPPVGEDPIVYYI